MCTEFLFKFSIFRSLSLQQQKVFRFWHARNRNRNTFSFDVIDFCYRSAHSRIERDAERKFPKTEKLFRMLTSINDNDRHFEMFRRNFHCQQNSFEMFSVILVAVAHFIHSIWHRLFQSPSKPYPKKPIDSNWGRSCVCVLVWFSSYRHSTTWLHPTFRRWMCFCATIAIKLKNHVQPLHKHVLNIPTTQFK